MNDRILKQRNFYLNDSYFLKNSSFFYDSFNIFGIKELRRKYSYFVKLTRDVLTIRRIYYYHNLLLSVFLFVNLARQTFALVFYMLHAKIVLYNERCNLHWNYCESYFALTRVSLIGSLVPPVVHGNVIFFEAYRLSISRIKVFSLINRMNHRHESLRDRVNLLPSTFNIRTKNRRIMEFLINK